MLKLAGVVGLVISCGLFGISRSTNIKMRIDLLEDYYQMIMILKAQINYFKEPLPDIFQKVSQNKDSKAFEFLKEIRIAILDKGCNTADLWHKKLMISYRDTVVTEEDIEIMAYLGEFIGQTDYENQLQHFLYLEQKLLQQISRAKEDYIKKSPMYNKIGFFVGGIIGILLI